MIKIDFERTDGIYTLRDAIILPDNHGLSDEEIEQIKETRWTNWIEMVTNPPQPEIVETIDGEVVNNG